jgi:hypothetical protein
MSNHRARDGVPDSATLATQTPQPLRHFAARGDVRETPACEGMRPEGPSWRSRSPASSPGAKDFRTCRSSSGVAAPPMRRATRVNEASRGAETPRLWTMRGVADESDARKRKDSPRTPDETASCTRDSRPRRRAPAPPRGRGGAGSRHAHRGQPPTNVGPGPSVKRLVGAARSLLAAPAAGARSLPSRTGETSSSRYARASGLVPCSRLERPGTIPGETGTCARTPPDLAAAGHRIGNSPEPQ